MTGRGAAIAPWLALVAALAVVLGIMARVPQSLNGDQAAQLRAAVQFVAGQSPSLNTVVQPDPAELSRDTQIWIVSRPPGPQLAAYPWLAAGFSLGAAARIVATLCLIAGSIGWLLWFQRFEPPRWLAIGIAAALPFAHEASNGLYVFSQDTLSWAAAPWALLLALSFQRRNPLAIGLALGATYVVKYSLLFLGLGALVWIATERSWRRFAWVAAGALVPIAVLSLLNAHYGVAINSVTAQAGFYPRASSLVALVANPALAVTDADGMVQRITTGAFAPLAIGLVPGLIFFWLVARGARGAPAPPSTRLAVSAFVVTIVAMGAVWTFSDFAADVTARHVAPASLAVLPVAALGAVRVWRRGWVGRVLVACDGLIVIAVPLLYGAAAMTAKAVRFDKGYHLGPSGVFNPFFGIDSGAIRRLAGETDVWYTDNALTALDLPGRVFSDVDERYLETRLSTTKRLRVTAVIQHKLEANGEGAGIRAEFTNAGPWTETAVPGALADVWTTTTISFRPYATGDSDGDQPLSPAQ